MRNVCIIISEDGRWGERDVWNGAWLPWEANAELPIAIEAQLEILVVHLLDTSNALGKK
jgi:hypothetical protein